MERRYTPWRGANYGTSRWPAVRLLLLGESHYADEDEDATIKWTKAYIAGGSGSFWTRTMQVVTGLHHSEVDRSEFWNDIAFYNYVQQPVGDSPRVRPTFEMFEAAQGAFWETLRELTPTHMLVLGAALWKNLPPEGQVGPDLKTEEGTRETWVYPLGDHKVLTTWIYHPSSIRGSRMARSFPFVRELVKLRNEREA